MKVLLKIANGKGLFLWDDFGVAKLVIGNIPGNYKPGQMFSEDENAWERGTYIHYWDYGNDTLNIALKELGGE